ncbi:hypothetical protein Moror_12921 [Moniliophthora roreri MCA 2997]|uniref:TEA domain-containing protein n=2 Tax=Moniliophthora roreri TaxID=221103 RepID=V2YQK1_MONRO|nr:hypothetical protein Moror_12921 [Moniliophthora roreri MCA 2997]KAI3607782.1 hypothetical protein WG66_004910 [Moniliophthora roreri]
MSYIDYAPSPVSAGSSRKHGGYVCMSTVDDLSYTPSAEEKDRDAAQIIATGRRSWKTLKGKGEAVWPPHLEAALIEALEKYKPDETRSTKTLGRFSMRNRFISDYIFETTGKRRTPKQVGSRLQQLRDTCKSDRILQLISRRPIEHDSESATVSSDGNSSSTPPPADAYYSSGNERSTGSRRNGIWVNIVLEQPSWPSPPPVVHIINNNKLMPLVVHLAPLSSSSHVSLNYDSSSSHRLAFMEPTINFASPCALALHCSYYVFLDGAGLPIHTEVAPLKCQSSPMQSSGWMYSASLVPGLWSSLCESASPTRYTITQTLYPARSAASSRPSSDNNGESCITIVYNFTHHESSTGFHQNLHGSDLTLPLPPNHDLPALSDPRSWCATTTLDWGSSFDSFGSGSPPSGYPPAIPSIARGGRSNGCYPESWNGQKYTPSLSSVQYC